MSVDPDVMIRELQDEIRKLTEENTGLRAEVERVKGVNQRNKPKFDAMREEVLALRDRVNVLETKESLRRKLMAEAVANAGQMDKDLEARAEAILHKTLRGVGDA